MPDVGVLNLQIQENSESAIRGLDNLVGALERVKNAVSGGLKLSPIATGLKKIGQVVDENIHGSTIVKIGQLADELSKLKGLGTINIKINGSGAVESMRDSVREARDSMGGINTGFDEIGARAYSARGNMEGFNSTVRDTAELMQNRAWTAGVEEFRRLFEEMSRLRMMFSLPAGAETGMSTQVEQGWTSWKNGAIEVEGTVSDAMDTVTARLGEPIPLLTGMASQLGDINSYLGRSIDMVDEFGRKTSSMSSGENAIIPYTGGQTKLEEGLEQIKVKADDARDSIETMGQVAKEYVNSDFMPDTRDYSLNGWGNTPPTPRVNVESEREAIDYVDELISKSSDVDLLNMKIEALRDKLVDGVNTGKMTGDQIARTVEKIRELKEQIEEAEQSTYSFKGALESVRLGINNLGIVKLIKQFTRLARTRMLRAVIKQIASGFKEGVENVYNYSKAIGGNFAPSLDSAVSSLQTMKNSIGAAAAPLIQSLIPLMQTLVNWFIEGVNYLNQFISLLRGQSTWTRALPATATAFDKQTKAAKKTGNAIKDLLADWDELNIIQSQTSGSGTGTSAAEDYLNMFEEVSEFDNAVKKVTDFIKDNMGDVVDLVKKAGIALLAWKFSKAFTGVLGTIGALVAAGEVIAISWKLTEMFDEKYLEEHDDGWLVADALTNLVGATLAGGIVATVLGGGAGLITAGIELTVSGGISYGIALAHEEDDKAEALKTLGLIKFAIGDLLMAAGFAIVAGPAGFVVGAALGAVMFTIAATVEVVVEQIKTAEEIADQAFAKTGEGGISVDEIFSALQTKFDEASKNFSLSIDAFSNVPTLKTDLAEAVKNIGSLSGLVRGGEALTQDEADKFKKAWETVFSAFEGITKDSFSTVFEGLNASLSSEIDTIREKGKELRIELLKVEQGMSQAQAEFKVKMEDLEGKVAAGKATPEELEEYFRYVDAVAQAANVTTHALDEVVKEGQNIDFGDQEHVLENVTNFINNAAEAAKTDIDSIDAGLQANIDAIQTLRDEIEMYHTLGIIDDPTYQMYSSIFDQTEENIKAAAEEKKAAISSTLLDTYKKVLTQAFEGLDEVLIGEGGEPEYFDAAIYMMRYIAPIIKAIQDAGGEVDEEFANMFGIGISMKDMVAALADANDENDMISWLKKYYAGEIDDATSALSGPDVPAVEPELDVEPKVNLSAWQIEDAIYEAIWDAAEEGTLSADLIRELAEKYGLDLQGVLDNMQIEYQMDDTVEQLKQIVEEINETDGLELHLPDVDDAAAAKHADEAAAKYEDMASRIRAAFKSLDGVGFSLNMDGMNGNLTVTLPQIPMAATGAMVRSGDLVMANENGNFEMMGRMGRQPVIANNQQIVEGITNGVSNANGDVVSELRGLSGLMRQMLNGGLVAKVMPSSTMGRSNNRSAEAYDRVTG